jgi:multiple sugar transport system permease protein
MSGPFAARGFRSHRLERNLGPILVAPALAVLALFAFWPVIGSAWLSLHRVVLSLPGLGEPFVGLDNYRELLASAVFWRSLVVTLLFVAASTALEIVLGLGLALCLHASFRGRGWVRAAALVPWAVPTVVASQMWRFLFNDRYGPVSWYLLGGSAPLADPTAALLAVIVADVWKTTAFVALILLAGLQVIPDEVLDAAEVDGAGPVRRFLSVTLPLLRPALLAALLFRTIDAFRVFDLVFVMTQGGPADATNVLQYLGYKRMFAEGMMGSGAAVSTLVFAMTLAVSILYIRAVGSALWEEEGR